MNTPLDLTTPPADAEEAVQEEAVIPPATMAESASGPVAIASGYQIRPGKEGFEFDGMILTNENITHSIALNMLKRGKLLFRENITSCPWPIDAPYWEGIMDQAEVSPTGVVTIGPGHATVGCATCP